MPTVRTAPGITPRALLVPLPVGQPGSALDRALDNALHLGQRRWHRHLHLGKRLRGLHPLIAEALEAFRQGVWHHPTNKPVDIDGVALHALGAVGAGMGGDPLPLRTIDASDRERRAHHVLGDVTRHTLRLRRHFALLHVGHQTIGGFPETSIYQPLDRISLKAEPSKSEAE